VSTIRNQNAPRPTGTRGPVIWPLLLVGVGILLLLHNFLFLGDFDLISLWPLTLVVVGAIILLRGDASPSNDGRTFGITRGSVESATLVVQSGEIDVSLGALEHHERLAAGQYAHQSRPALNVDGTHARLMLDRSRTPWLSWVDWQIGLAPNLPWEINIGSHIGQIDCDTSGLILNGALASTGFGDIRWVGPLEALQPIALRSTLGTIQFIAPASANVRVIISQGMLSKLHVNEQLYTRNEDGSYSKTGHDASSPVYEVFIYSRVGDVFLI